MSDKCSFCGLGESPPNTHGEIVSYVCGTLTNDPEPRTKLCLRGALDRERERVDWLKALVREMGEIIQETASSYFKSSNPDKTNGRFLCEKCYADFELANHTGNCIVGKAQEILSRPEVRRIMEEEW
jgi:hypothetical protein